ncbi:hypothetical protein GUJ93_ZPchr0012g20620 [Zizania palustris]|uniref:Sec-independent protein translocase protein TATB, chloroplastic n=1 Tax=Zizania palustris TaxID=103762 RepID=A0A8J5WT35_ZIZPA|nr:hypothetical protein GUJ93_ZPchr0012g20620 [Zizania palustris]
MAVAGLLLRPPPCISTSACTLSPSLSSPRRVTLSQSQTHGSLGLGFVAYRHHHRHRFLLRRRTENKRRSRGTCVYASLFGVGAPEALVIGVVALLVFGPKGLAEVARNLGKTLRAFQPTIRELQDVSREFRSTLEREIGLDEVPPSTNYMPTTMNNSQQPAVNPKVSDDNLEAVPYTSEELMKVTEEQLAASAAAAWSTQGPPPSQQKATTSQGNDDASSKGNDGDSAGAATNRQATGARRVRLLQDLPAGCLLADAVGAARELHDGSKAYQAGHARGCLPRRICRRRQKLKDFVFVVLNLHPAMLSPLALGRLHKPYLLSSITPESRRIQEHTVTALLNLSIHENNKARL